MQAMLYQPTTKAMKTIAIAGIVLITAFMPSPARAVPELLPYTFAEKYCDLRSIGVDRWVAITEAVKGAFTLNGNQPIMVKVGRKSYRSDILIADAAAKKACPEFY
jgi:hypothetical protein